MDLTFEHFKDRIGERFSATSQDGAGLELTLSEAKERAASPNASQGFSLLFRSAEQEPLDQQIFDVDHPELGHHTIFMVPIAAGADGVSYEAVFTR